MMTAPPVVSDMLITVKSREIQRALQARLGGKAEASERHFLAAAHLELVLADDYDEIREHDLARRSRVSAASCLWQAGQVDRARAIFDAMIAAHPDEADELRASMADLQKSIPATKPRRNRSNRSL